MNRKRTCDTADDDRYALEVTGLPGWSTPTAQRLRRFLKAARRQFGLRCVQVIEVAPRAATDDHSKLVTAAPGKAPNDAEHPFE